MHVSIWLVNPLRSESTAEMQRRWHSCCFATQDKVRVTVSGGEKWEVYTDSESDTFGTSPQHATLTTMARCAAAIPLQIVADEIPVASC